MAYVSPDTIDYGRDLSCMTDLTSTATEVTGRLLLAESCVRRLQTDQGALIDDPNYGYNIVGEIDNDLTDRDIARIASQVDNELMKDERIRLSQTTASYVQKTGILTVSIRLTDHIGPFTLVLAISAVTIDILKVG